ncbi:angiotensinogen [Polypterus senegalus]|nr:angiotensinogen [Polypterus senegalus]XP_039604163.1 angiotensinogen [Polypterus senegalus]
MHTIMGAFILLFHMNLANSNRVYVHPFKLFSLGNISCENPGLQNKILPDNNLVVPNPITFPHNVTEEAGQPQKDSEVSGQNLTQNSVLAGLQNELGLRMYHELRKQNASGNILLSPINIFGTLVTLYLGAAKQTAADLQRLIGIVEETDNENCTSPIDGQKILHALQTINAPVGQSSDELSTAAWLFLNKGIHLQKGFVERTHDFADHTYLKEVDFSDPLSAENFVNSFVEVTSSKKVKSLFKGIDPTTDLLFASNFHLKGRWGKGFDIQQTKIQDFSQTDKSSILIPLMSQTGNFYYINDKMHRCSVVKLPLNNNSFLMLIYPNNDKDLHHIENHLKTHVIYNWQKYSKKRCLTISLPKFSMTATSDLKEILKKMNLPQLIDKNADFTRLSNKENLTVDKVLNTVVFEVSEQGSQKHDDCQDNSHAPFQMKIDKPFLFIVVESLSNAILMLGRITHPEYH